MRERFRRPAPTGQVAGLAVCAALAAPLPAMALDDPALGGTGAGIGDFLEYNTRLGSVYPCDTVSIPSGEWCTFLNGATTPDPDYPFNPLSDLLTGSLPPPAGNAGGNVELFANSETLSLNGFVAYTGVTTLTGTLDGAPVEFSSLTWNDFEIDSFDCTGTPTATPTPGGLFDRWLGDLLAAYTIPGTTKEQIAGLAICGGFLQRLPDPNIAYANDNDPGNGSPDATIGLAGTFDLCATLVAVGILPPGSCAAIPEPIQISEIVKFEAEGMTTFLYRIGNGSAVASGQRELQEPNSHTGIYEVVAPSDPPTATKVGVVVGDEGTKTIIEWTMEWVNNAPEDRYVRIFDRLPESEYVDGSLTCNLVLLPDETPIDAAPIPDGPPPPDAPPDLTYGDAGSGAEQNISDCAYRTDVGGIIGNDGIVFLGVIPGTDRVLANEYQNSVHITFQVELEQPVDFPLENTACVTWDTDGDGDLNPGLTCRDGVTPEPEPGPGPEPIPAIQPAGLALLSLGLMVAFGWARSRRRT